MNALSTEETQSVAEKPRNNIYKNFDIKVSGLTMETKCLAQPLPALPDASRADFVRRNIWRSRRLFCNMVMGGPQCRPTIPRFGKPSCSILSLVAGAVGIGKVFRLLCS